MIDPLLSVSICGGFILLSTSRIFQLNGAICFLVAILNDHRRIDRKSPGVADLASNIS